MRFLVACVQQGNQVLRAARYGKNMITWDSFCKSHTQVDKRLAMSGALLHICAFCGTHLSVSLHQEFHQYCNKILSDDATLPRLLLHRGCRGCRHSDPGSCGAQRRLVNHTISMYVTIGHTGGRHMPHLCTSYATRTQVMLDEEVYAAVEARSRCSQGKQGKVADFAWQLFAGQLTSNLLSPHGLIDFEYTSTIVAWT